MTEFRKISIIGLGLIASSICLTIRQKDPEIQIVGYDKDKGVRKNEIFEGNRAREVEKERKKWINKNSKVWTDFIRPKETVFYTNRTKKLYKSENLINEIDIVNWNNIVEGDKNKVWEVVKIKIKHRVTQLQVKKWNNAKEGKVLRIYKKYWWNDKIVSEIQDPGIHFIS